MQTFLAVAFPLTMLGLVAFGIIGAIVTERRAHKPRKPLPPTVRSPVLLGVGMARTVGNIRTLASLALVVIVLTGCKPSNTAEAYRDSKLDNGDVTQTAIAPDGTVLWSVRVDGRIVYFSGGGALWSESCGKSCSSTVTVPRGGRK